MLIADRKPARLNARTPALHPNFDGEPFEHKQRMFDTPQIKAEQRACHGWSNDQQCTRKHQGDA